jgi:hypothetical protein
VVACPCEDLGSIGDLASMSRNAPIGSSRGTESHPAGEGCAWQRIDLVLLVLEVPPRARNDVGDDARIAADLLQEGTRWRQR